MTAGLLAAHRDWRLRRLVAHAYARVPYYRRLLDAHGVSPGDIRGAADLARLPITSKRDLLAAAPRDLVASGLDPDRLIPSTTSGSSGEPFVVRRTWLEQNLMHAFRLRALRSFGQRATDRVAVIDMPPTVDRRDNKLVGRALQAVGLHRMTKVDTLLPPAELLAELERLRPDVIAGYPGVLSRLAEATGPALRRVLRPRLLWTGAEVLTPALRREIVEAFGAPLFNVYGSTEFNLLGWECGVTGELHVPDDLIVLEILVGDRPAAPGERGEVVATALFAHAMPFIRYRLGDIVTRGSERCDCGRPFSTIRDVTGRMVDYFRLPDGRIIHPYEITVALVRSIAPWVRRHQMVQEREDRVVLRLVADPVPSADEVARMRDGITAFLGPAVELELLLVPEIPPEPSGKFRQSYSLVRSAYDAVSAGVEW